MTDNTSTDAMRRIYASALRFLRLNVENARLVTAEKLTLLFSSIAFVAVAIITGFIALLFVSIGVGQILTKTIAPQWAFMFIAGFYVIVFIAVILLKKRLFINPIARFMSRLLLEPPKSQENEE